MPQPRGSTASSQSVGRKAVRLTTGAVLFHCLCGDDACPEAYTHDGGQSVVGDRRVELLRKLYRGEDLGDFVPTKDPWAGLEHGRAVVTKEDVDWASAGERVTG